MRSLFFIVLACLFLASAGYLGHKYLYQPVRKDDLAPIVAETTPAIWALRLDKEVARGDILDKGQLQWHPLPNDQDGHYFLTREKIVLSDWQGAAFSRELKKGAYVQATDLVHPSEAGYLKTLLAEGMRARPVKIDNLGDFSTLRPGDHVDLILIYAASSHAARAGEAVVKTILEDIRVVGLKNDKSNASAGVLILGLSPKEVELTSMAEAVGKLRISLHGSSRGKSPIATVKNSASSASDFFPELKPASVALARDNSREIRIMRGGDSSVVTLSSSAGK